MKSLKLKSRPFKKIDGADFYRLAIIKGIRINEVRLPDVPCLVDTVEEQLTNAITHPRFDGWLRKAAYALILGAGVMVTVHILVAVVMG
jgi:hypothetical protein